MREFLFTNPDQGTEMIDRHLHYVHHNPVEAGFVLEPEHWCYSSATDYGGGKGYLNIEFLD